MNYASYVPHYDDFPHEAFERAARECSDGDIMVEVGTFLGHGACYMAECLVAYDKRPKFYAIDTWDQVLEKQYGENRTGDMPWGESIETWRARGNRLYDWFRFYVDGCPHKDRIYDHVSFPAQTCMEEFADNSVSWVYLGYSRKEESIQREIDRWMPKLTANGHILTRISETGHIQQLPKRICQ